ncbi:MAG: ATP-binding protein [Lachnospiraceae bacterium]|nr:ATP-binding protein [Lachnospiraceae bacterium]
MVGRKKEVKELNRLYERKQAELIAIYGRRRVGKTYLVDETFAGRITFRHAGLSPADENSKGLLKLQLNHFYNSLKLHGMEKCDKPSNWLDAFLLLEQFLQSRDDGSRQVVFLDELPWLDTPKSGFIRAFEAFWNTWGCHRKNLMVIVCGSANSWIQDKLINNHGGLYNRVTYEIKLSPFNLKECEEFYKSNNVNISRYDITQSYMIFGGIPYYMGYVNGEMSLAQNIDNIFFKKNAILREEYNRLFASVFVNPEAVKDIVQLLYTRNAGFTRREIIDKLGITDGGRLSRNLNALISSDFIIKYVPFGCGKREEHYKLIDPFCMFYLHFINNQKKVNEKFWQQNTSSGVVAVWRGFAFENVCFNHIEQIKRSLGISGVISDNSAWSKRGDDNDGTQIDLIISRNDNVINMCEIKYYSGEFTVNKEYYKTILKRQALLAENVSPKAAIHSTLITTFGLTHNEYSGAFTNVIVLDDLFKEE